MSKSCFKTLEELVQSYEVRECRKYKNALRLGDLELEYTIHMQENPNSSEMMYDKYLIEIGEIEVDDSEVSDKTQCIWCVSSKALDRFEKIAEDLDFYFNECVMDFRPLLFKAIVNVNKYTDLDSIAATDTEIAIEILKECARLISIEIHKMLDIYKERYADAGQIMVTVEDYLIHNAVYRDDIDMIKYAGTDWMDRK